MSVIILAHKTNIENDFIYLQPIIYNTYLFYKQLTPCPSDMPLPEAAQDGMPPAADGSAQCHRLCACGS